MPKGKYVNWKFYKRKVLQKMNEYLQKQRHAVDLTDGQIASFHSAYLKVTRQADIQWFMNFIPKNLRNCFEW